MPGTGTRLLLVAALVVGCGTPDAQESALTMSHDDFAEVYVALRVAAHEAKDQQDFEARRDTILERRGLDAAALERFVQHRGHDTAGLVRMWGMIEAELERRLNLDPSDQVPAPAGNREPDPSPGLR